MEEEEEAPVEEEVEGAEVSAGAAVEVVEVVEEVPVEEEVEEEGVDAVAVRAAPPWQ